MREYSSVDWRAVYLAYAYFQKSLVSVEFAPQKVIFFTTYIKARVEIAWVLQLGLRLC